jgi:hypothetical protein
VYIRRCGAGLLLDAVYHVRMKTLLVGLLLGIVRVTYLPETPGTAARWGALSSLVGGLLGAATFLPFLTPYLTRGNVEATDTLTTGLVSSGSPQLALATVLSVLGIVGLYGTLVAHSGRPDALAVSGASLAALSAVSLLALLAYITAGSLGWLHPPGEDMFWWEQRITTLLQEVGMGAYALGLVLVGTSAFRARLFGRLRAPAAGRRLAVAGEHRPSPSVEHVWDGLPGAHRRPAFLRCGALRVGNAQPPPHRT